MKTRTCFLFPIICVLVSLSMANFLTVVIFFTVTFSIYFYITREDVKVKAITLIPAPNLETLESMQQQSLALNEIFPISECKSEICPICPLRSSKISNLDFSIQVNISEVPKYRTSKIQSLDLSYQSKPLPKILTKTNEAFEVSFSSQKELQTKHQKDSEIFLNFECASSMDLFNTKFIPRIETLHQDVFTYYSQLNYQKEEVVKQPKIPGARIRFLIEPAEEAYQRLINEKIEIYKKTLESSKKAINTNLKIELESISSQITSDLKDLEHLNSRISAALALLQNLKDEELNHAIYILCESVVSRGAGQADSIDAGPNFALNFTNYILSIAKSYPAIHEIYFLALVKIKHSYYPILKQDEVEIISKRSELKDFSPDGRLGEGDKEKFKMQMDRARAFAFLLGSLFASKESKFNEGDIWRWLAFVLNLPIEHVDRSHLPILFGFLRTTGFRLNQGYGKQFRKVVEFLQGPYLDSLNNKFGKNPYLKSYITQLREVIKNL